MHLFPDEIESERLCYQRFHPDSIDSPESYERTRVGAPHIDETTEYLTWDSHDNPKEVFDWVETTLAVEQWAEAYREATVTDSIRDEFSPAVAEVVTRDSRPAFSPQIQPRK